MDEYTVYITTFDLDTYNQLVDRLTREKIFYKKLTPPMKGDGISLDFKYKGFSSKEVRHLLKGYGTISHCFKC